LDGFVVGGVRKELAGVAQPADVGCVVTKGKYTVLLTSLLFALQDDMPDRDHHSKELKDVVSNVDPIDGA
jgi:hypothetical protein